MLCFIKVSAVYAYFSTSLLLVVIGGWGSIFNPMWLYVSTVSFIIEIEGFVRRHYVLVPHLLFPHKLTHVKNLISDK